MYCVFIISRATREWKWEDKRTRSSCNQQQDHNNLWCPMINSRLFSFDQDKWNILLYLFFDNWKTLDGCSFVCRELITTISHSITSHHTSEVRTMDQLWMLTTFIVHFPAISILCKVGGTKWNQTQCSLTRQKSSPKSRKKVVITNLPYSRNIKNCIFFGKLFCMRERTKIDTTNAIEAYEHEFSV